MSRTPSSCQRAEWSLPDETDAHSQHADFLTQFLLQNWWRFHFTGSRNSCRWADATRCRFVGISSTEFYSTSPADVLCCLTRRSRRRRRVCRPTRLPSIISAELNSTSPADVRCWPSGSCRRRRRASVRRESDTARRCCLLLALLPQLVSAIRVLPCDCVQTCP